MGVSTHQNEPAVIRAAVEEKIYDVILTAYNFRQPHWKEVKQAIAYAAQEGLGIVGMKVLAGAYWDRERKQPINAKAKEILKKKDLDVITCRECDSCAVFCTMGFDVAGKLKDIPRLLDVPDEFLV